MSNDLNLIEKEHDEQIPAESLISGDHVILYSEKYDSKIAVKITHKEAENIGGNITTDPGHPLAGRGDHIHFKVSNVLEIK